MTQQDFEDRLADLITDATQSGLSLDEIIDGVSAQLQVLNEEVRLREVAHG